ncbi:MAG TPA: hypothetical protein VMY78_16995 [Solirubrobacteraceae bacterium]|nr:hypothetical protein [Solirubrobacteraceae bacterium]
MDLATVGPLMSIRSVNERALELLSEVYNDRAAEAPQAATTASDESVANKRPQPRPRPPYVVRDPDNCNTIDVPPTSG